MFPYCVPELERLLRVLRPKLTDEEKIACCGLWAQSMATEDQPPSITFEEFIACVQTGKYNKHTPYELVHACSWYQQFPIVSPKSEHLQKVGPVYTLSTKCRLQVEAFMYVLLWGDRKRRDMEGMDIFEQPYTMETHTKYMQPVLRWLLRVAAVLPSTEIEPMLINLYASLCAPLLACVQPGSAGLSVYQQYRDMNTAIGIPSFAEDIATCAQTTASAMLSQLLPKADGDYSMAVSAPALVHACAALSIFCVFLNTVCVGDDALIFADDDILRGKVATFKIRTDASIAACSVRFVDRFVLHYSKDVAYVGFTDTAVGRYYPPAPDVPPTPYYIIHEILVLIQSHCKPNTHIAQALHLIDDPFSPDGDCSAPLFYCASPS